MPGPLAGVRVVELGVWIAGPAAACILGDWGAEIVKIEPPGLGDPARAFARMLGGDLPGNPPFEMDNRNKRSAVVNLQTPEGLELALELIASADVFLTNLRPAALLRLGLGHETLLRQHPRLIYALVTGYGLSGPEAERGAYDIAAFWARSSVAWALSRPGETPPFQRGGMGDHVHTVHRTIEQAGVPDVTAVWAHEVGGSRHHVPVDGGHPPKPCELVERSAYCGLVCSAELGLLLGQLARNILQGLPHGTRHPVVFAFDDRSLHQTRGGFRGHEHTRQGALLLRKLGDSVRGGAAVGLLHVERSDDTLLRYRQPVQALGCVGGQTWAGGAHQVEHRVVAVGGLHDGARHEPEHDIWVVCLPQLRGVGRRGGLLNPPNQLGACEVRVFHGPEEAALY